LAIRAAQSAGLEATALRQAGCLTLRALAGVNPSEIKHFSENFGRGLTIFWNGLLIGLLRVEMPGARFLNLPVQAE
jgi:hypothetical protein